MIDSTKFKYHLGDIIQDSVFLTQGIIVGYWFLGGFNNYIASYGYCIELFEDSIKGHSGEEFGYHANGKHINPIYANKIIYIDSNECACVLVKSIRPLIYKLLLI